MNKSTVWENMGYVTLILCIIGQLTVGYVYIPAQCAYLIANGANLIRQFALHRPIADKVRDSAFLAITIGLIVLRLTGH